MTTFTIPTETITQIVLSTITSLTTLTTTLTTTAIITTRENITVTAPATAGTGISQTSDILQILGFIFGIIITIIIEGLVCNCRVKRARRVRNNTVIPPNNPFYG